MNNIESILRGNPAWKTDYITSDSLSVKVCLQRLYNSTDEFIVIPCNKNLYIVEIAQEVDNKNEYKIFIDLECESNTKSLEFYTAIVTVVNAFPTKILLNPIRKLYDNEEEEHEPV